MAKLNQFNKYSDYYDIIYQEKSYLEEANFIKKTIKAYSPIKVNTMLSLGCGTASYEIILAADKYSITGVDLSAKMLKIGEKKITENKIKNIRLIKADIKNYRLNNKFDFAMAMFNVIGYQTNNDFMEKTLQNTARHLKKNSLFVFDCWYLPAVLKDRPTNRFKKLKLGEKTIVRKTSQNLDLEKNLININFHIREYKKNKLTNYLTENHPMRFWTLTELDYFLAKNNFKLIKSCVFMNLNKNVSPDNWNIFIIAQKI